MQAPRLDQHEEHERAQRLRDPIDRDVDERLGLQLDMRRQRQEQDLARRLVDGVAQRLVEHPREARRPQRPVQQHDDGRRAEADGQHHQREADAQVTVNAARQPHLDDESNRRRPQPDLGQELRDRVGRAGALGGLGRHVELLLDDRRADGGKADHERDDLQVLRFAQQFERFERR